MRDDGLIKAGCVQGGWMHGVYAKLQLYALLEHRKKQKQQKTMFIFVGSWDHIIDRPTMQHPRVRMGLIRTCSVRSPFLILTAMGNRRVYLCRIPMVDPVFCVPSRLVAYISQI
jgi:hypothetical protein